MRNSNFTYILIVVAIAAAGLSIRGYIFLGDHQVQQLTPVEQLIAGTPPITQTSVLPDSKIVVVTKPSSKQQAVKSTTQTPAVVPVTPTLPVVQPAPVIPVVIATPISLPYSVDNFPTKNAWRSIVGSIGLKFVDGPYKRNLLTTSADANTVDGRMELAGSEGWKDYSFTVKINFISGTTFSLIARYQDSKNYTSCIFSQGGDTRLSTTVDGKTSTIAEDRNQIPTIPNVTDVSYTVSVLGNKVQCFVNGAPVGGMVSVIPSTGGIAIDVYNQAPGSSELDVQEVNVIKQ